MSLPPLRIVQARWSALVAVCAAVQRTDIAGLAGTTLSHSWPGRPSSALFPLPDGRAVWVAEAGAPPVDAPVWVRAALADLRVGFTDKPLLWWDGDEWGGDAATVREAAAVFPGFGSTADVIDELVTFHVPAEWETAAGQVVRDAAFGLVHGCETHSATRAAFRWFTRSCGAAEDDVDRGFGVLARAGLTDANTAPVPDYADGLTRQQALDAVARYFADEGLDLPKYAPQGLVAQRLELGWWVYAQATGRRVGAAWFFVGDDGVVARSSSSLGPAAAAEEFAAGYRARHAPPAAEPGPEPPTVSWSNLPPTMLPIPADSDRLHVHHRLLRPPLPEVTDEDVEWSRGNPEQWRYFIDPHVDPDQAEPHNLRGGRQADGNGGFSHWWVNPDFVPTREFAGIELTTDLDVALYRLLAGYSDIGTFVTALGQAELYVVRPVADPGGRDWPTYSADGHDTVLDVYTSPKFLPPEVNPERSSRVDGGHVAVNLCSRGDVVITFNPESALTVQLPGNDLFFWSCELVRAEAADRGIDPDTLFSP